jgi:hypothetical protein
MEEKKKAILELLAAADDRPEPSTMVVVTGDHNLIIAGDLHLHSPPSPPVDAPPD